MTRHRPARRAVSRILIGLAIVCQADVIFGASYTVDPTVIELSPRSTSITLTIRNESSDTVRFQLKVFAWDQKPDGEMVLNPTQDIVFFPTLFSLPAKQDRRIRVAASVPFGPAEKTYRIIVEELRSEDKAPAGSGVAVLTNVSVPIFLRPAAPKAAVSLTNVALRNGRAEFDLQNIGNMRILPRSGRITGFNASGARLFASDLQAWYVLASGTRHFSVDLNGGQCQQVRRLEVEFAFESNTIKERLETPAGVCRS